MPQTPPGLRRHDRLRDRWICLCRRTGWHIDAEQNVSTNDHDNKRADFLALPPDGTWIAADAMVTATPTPGIHMEATKRPKPLDTTPVHGDGHVMAPQWSHWSTMPSVTGSPRLHCASSIDWSWLQPPDCPGGTLCVWQPPHNHHGCSVATDRVQCCMAAPRCLQLTAVDSLGRPRLYIV